MRFKFPSGETELEIVAVSYKRDRRYKFKIDIIARNFFNRAMHRRFLLALFLTWMTASVIIAQNRSPSSSSADFDVI